MSKSALLRLISGICVAIFAMGHLAPASAYVTPRIKPPAPGPAYLSSNDHARLQIVAQSAKKKRFSQAKTTIAAIEDPIAKSLGEWLYFSAEDPLVDIQAADRFLDSHSDWPAVSRIQSHVESRIPKNASTKTILELFDSRDPITGSGKVALAGALFKSGDEDAGKIYLRDAWVDSRFTIAEERAVLSKYGRRLTQEDHAARVDRLLWARQVTNARRIFSRLKAKDRRMAEARAELILGASRAATTFGNLREEERLDSGVLLAAVRYFRRRGDQQYAISLAAQSPKDPEELRNSARWWYERQLLMRWALKNGRFAEAYTAASNHGLDRGGAFAEAEFNAGWIALRFLDEPARAETHFLALASAVGTPISLSRSYYWLGRAAEARNMPELAKTHYETAAEHIYSYYGQLAAEKVGGPALETKFSPPSKVTPHEYSIFTSRPTVAALRMLSDLDLDHEFMVFAYHIDDQLESPGEYLELAKILTGEGAPHLTVRAGKVAVRKEAFTPEVAYPLIFVPDEAKRYVEPAIILGLSRQESEFNPRAFSRAGARGVMQLIPSTAQITARKAGMRYSRSALLDDPVYNMTIGSAHLSHLLERYEGSLVMTFAAYNAGAGRVTQWVATYGDPRGPEIDPIDWVELIPFAETRNYVQRVLENTQVYRARLNVAPIPGRLSADLGRGGFSKRAAHAVHPSPTLVALAKELGPQNLSALPAKTKARADAFANKITRERLAAKAAEAQLAAQALEAAAPTNDEASAKLPNVVVPAAPDAPQPAQSVSPISMTEETSETTAADPAPEETAPAISSTTAETAPAAKETNIVASDDKPVAAPVAITSASDVTLQPKPAATPSAPAPRIYLPGEVAPNDNEAEDLNAQQLGQDWFDSEAAEPVITAPETPVSDVVQQPGALDEAPTAAPLDGCMTYREFLAEIAAEEGTADEMLSELLQEGDDGGLICK